MWNTARYNNNNAMLNYYTATTDSTNQAPAAGSQVSSYSYEGVDEERANNIPVSLWWLHKQEITVHV